MNFSYLFRHGQMLFFGCRCGYRGGKIVSSTTVFGNSQMPNFFVAAIVDKKKIQNLYIYAMACKRHTATLLSMGLRAEASLAKHLLLENCWENNLLPYIQSRLLGRPPRPNKPPAIGGSAAVCRRHLRVRVFGPNRDRSHSQQSILRASVEADSSQNCDGGARSPRWPSRKHKDLEHSACKC